jgi:hypothetical protein
MQGSKESLSDLGGRILEGHHLRSVGTISLIQRGTTGAPGWQRLTNYRVPAAYRTPERANPETARPPAMTVTAGRGTGAAAKADLRQAGEKPSDAFRQ